MKKILATGGTGYIGSHTVVELINRGYEVEIIDNLFNSKKTVIDQIEKITGKRPKFFEADMLDAKKLDKIFQQGNYDAVIHFAGLKAVGESVEKPILYYRNNLDGTLNLLDAMGKYGVKELIFSSSATVYGVQETPFYVETMKTGGEIASPYGRTKLFIEEIIKDYVVAHPDFSATLLRYFILIRLALMNLASLAKIQTVFQTTSCQSSCASPTAALKSFRFMATIIQPRMALAVATIYMS